MEQSSERPTAYPSARDDIGAIDVGHLPRLTHLTDPATRAFAAFIGVPVGDVKTGKAFGLWLMHRMDEHRDLVARGDLTGPALDFGAWVMAREGVAS